MADMKFKENGGVDPVTLSRGYTALDGDPPNSGENIFKPEHVEIGKRMEKMMSHWPDEEQPDDGPDGFLTSDKPTPFDRPWRTEEEDRG